MQLRSAVLTQALHMAMGPIPTGGIGFVRGASATGTRARVARVKAEYPSQLDYSGVGQARPPGPSAPRPVAAPHGGRQGITGLVAEYIVATM